MITDNQKKKIKEVLTKHYSHKIIDHLTENAIFNAKGNEFSSASIQRIVSGEQSNETVELEIAKLVAKTREEQKEAQKIKKQLFK
jgi:hypothetical protein